jgi:hypothetical protein
MGKRYRIQVCVPMYVHARPGIVILFLAGLPDFSWYNIPKLGNLVKCTKWPQGSNGRKINQIKYTEGLL